MSEEILPKDTACVVCVYKCECVYQTMYTKGKHEEVRGGRRTEVVYLFVSKTQEKRKIHSKRPEKKDKQRVGNNKRFFVTAGKKRQDDEEEGIRHKRKT